MLQSVEAEHHLDPQDRGSLGPWLVLYPKTFGMVDIADVCRALLDSSNS